jgi:hypothetical protein
MRALQTDVTSNDIVCNVGGTSGAGVATVDMKAGDKITVQVCFVELAKALKY